MGLHIYAGSLVRFYKHDWENEIARLARENGIAYETAWATGEPKWPNDAKARKRVREMRRVLEKKFRAASIDWDDDAESYDTVKLHDEGREALVLAAAHTHRPDLPWPTQMPREAYEDIAYSEAAAKKYLVGPIAGFESSLVIPGTFQGLTFIRSPLDEEVLTCSTAFLSAALDAVKASYLSDDAQQDAWLADGLAYSRNASTSEKVEGVWVERSEPEPADSFLGNVRFAYSAYRRMLSFSNAHRCAIALW